MHKPFWQFCNIIRNTFKKSAKKRHVADESPDVHDDLAVRNDNAIEKLELQGRFNSGWLGLDLITDQQRYFSAEIKPELIEKANDLRQKLSSELNLAFTNYPNAVSPYQTYGTLAQYIKAISYDGIKLAQSKKNTECNGISIITTYRSDMSFFGACTNSVRKFMDIVDAKGNGKKVEWIIVVHEEHLADSVLDLIPPEMISTTSIIGDSAEYTGVNAGIQQSKFEFLLFLQSNDYLCENAANILLHYMNSVDGWRVLISPPIDFNQRKEIIRFRQSFRPSFMIAQGALEGQLLFVRREVFDEFGLFKERFLKADCEFLVRVIEQEPILVIPEPLSFHRYYADGHNQTEIWQQRAVIERIQRVYLSKFISRQFEDSRLSQLNTNDTKDSERSSVEEGSVAIMLIVNDSDVRALQISLDSIKSQISSRPIAIMAVFTGKEDKEKLEHVIHESDSCIEILDCGLKKTTVGRSANMALENILDHQSIAAVAFMQSGDFLFPFFTQRLSTLLAKRAVDVVYSQTVVRDLEKEEEDVLLDLTPIADELKNNLLPLHSFMVTTASIAKSNARFDESSDEGAQHRLLKSLFENGCRFSPFFEVHSGSPQRRNQSNVNSTPETIDDAFESKLTKSILEKQIIDFDFASRSKLSAQEQSRLSRMLSNFDRDMS